MLFTDPAPAGSKRSVPMYTLDGTKAEIPARPRGRVAKGLQKDAVSLARWDDDTWLVGHPPIGQGHSASSQVLCLDGFEARDTLPDPTGPLRWPLMVALGLVACGARDCGETTQPCLSVSRSRHHPRSSPQSRRCSSRSRPRRPRTTSVWR